jgi:hypothetical protein
VKQGEEFMHTTIINEESEDDVRHNSIVSKKHTFHFSDHSDAGHKHATVSTTATTHGGIFRYITHVCDLIIHMGTDMRAM